MSNAKNDHRKGILFLVLAAMIWGLAFAAQKAGMNHLGPFTFTAIRCLLGGFSLIPLILFLDRRKSNEQKEGENNPKALVKGGVLCGLSVTVIAVAQQTGIVYTTIGKAGFITALYIVLIPLAGLLMKRKVEGKVWIAVLIALAGFYLMCLSHGMSQINKGDAIMLIAAVGCVFHLYFIDLYVNKVDPVKLSCVQFLTTGIICSVGAIIRETATFDDVVAVAIPLLYAGICSCGGGYTLQILGQKYIEPSKASLLLSSETVFTMIAGMIFFGEVLFFREYLGCTLILAAIIISQIKGKS